MINSKFVPAVLIFGLLACSTTQHQAQNDFQIQEDESPEYQSFKHGSLRSPAAESKDEAFERYDETFERMMNASDPTAEYLSQFDQLSHLYILAGKRLQEFDDRLDIAYQANQAGKPSSADDYSSQYANVLAVQANMNNLKSQIEYFYFKLLIHALNSSAPFLRTEFPDLKSFHRAVSLFPARHKVAIKIKLAVEEKFYPSTESASLTQVDEVALDEIKRSIEAIEVSYTNDLAKTDALSKPTPVRSRKRGRYSIHFNTRDEFERFASSLELKRSVLEQSKSLKLENHVLTEVNQKAKLFLNAIREQSQQMSREPQSAAVFYPSMDRHGNITGSSFPKGTWALTYDDGPHPKHTLRNIENLQKSEHNFKATFFWLAENVKVYTKVVGEVHKAGFPTENHSWDHPQLSKQSEDSLNHQIDEAQAVETKIYNEHGGNADTNVPNGPDLTPKFFRAPYGDGMNKPAVRSHIVKNNMIHVFWNVDTLDWQDRNPDSILDRTVKQIVVNKRGVILFHDVHPQSVIASDLLMTWFRDQMKTQRLRLVTIPGIVEEMNGGASAGEYSNP